MGSDEQDPDRAAILARRRQFVALALSGLASSACKHEPPIVCLQPMPSELDDTPADTSTTDDTTDDTTTADTSAPFVEDPGAPLTPAEPEQPDGQDEGEDAVEPKPRPQPCLKKRAPPRVCLFMSG